MRTGEGFLVVLSDVKAKDEEDYVAWLTTEHVQERLGIPGFCGVRIFRKPIPDGHQYLIWYRLRDADVVDSDEYVRRLNSPTEWSRRIMPILQNFGRGGGSVVASEGAGTGSRVAATAFQRRPSNTLEVIAGLKATPGVEAVHLLLTDSEKSAIQTNERNLRTSDNSFGGLLVIESNDENALQMATKMVPVEFADGNVVGGQYRNIFSLEI